MEHFDIVLTPPFVSTGILSIVIVAALIFFTFPTVGAVDIGGVVVVEGGACVFVSIPVLIFFAFGADALVQPTHSSLFDLFLRFALFFGMKTAVSIGPEMSTNSIFNRPTIESFFPFLSILTSDFLSSLKNVECSPQ